MNLRSFFIISIPTRSVVFPDFSIEPEQRSAYSCRIAGNIHTGLSYGLKTVVADMTLLFLATLSSGGLRRIAIAVLLCEFGIVAAGIVNALTFRLPVFFFYCEQIHLAFLVAFFVLFLMAATIMFVGRGVFALRAVDQYFNIPSERWAERYSTALSIAVPCLALVTYAISVRTYATNLTFPPNRPPSVELLARYIGLKPGAPFRGRLITLVGLENPQSRRPMGWRSGFGIRYREQPLPAVARQRPLP